MYNELLNYFENECCISNIFMRKYWMLWYIAIAIIIAIVFFTSNISNILVRYLIILSVGMLIVLSVFKKFFKVFKEELKKENKIEELEFPFLELLQEYRYIPAYYEFQLKKVKEYCLENDITNEEIQRFIQYIDEDIDKKFPKDRKNELFLSVVIPSIISIVTVYISNNKIKNIGEIVAITLSYVFVSLIITSGVYFIFSIRNLIVDKRRNYLELKDVLRNVNMDRVKEEKKIILKE